jgi:hypothetical protein
MMSSKVGKPSSLISILGLGAIGARQNNANENLKTFVLLSSKMVALDSNLDSSTATSRSSDVGACLSK